MAAIFPDIDRSAAEWPGIDLSILDERRGNVPPFPLERVPQPWRNWIADAASSTGAPADYVALAVLAALAGLCGAGTRVQITAGWSEPMVLWLMAVGEPSTGKSAALAPMHRLLGDVEAGMRARDDERRERLAERARAGAAAEPFVASQIVTVEESAKDIAELMAGNPRGVLLWRDTASVWLGESGGDRDLWRQAWAAGEVVVRRPGGKGALSLGCFPVSVLSTAEPDRLKDARQPTPGLAARFLAWPAAHPYRGLAAGKVAPDDEALARLRRLLLASRTPDDPLVLSFDAQGVKALEAFLAGLHRERQGTEGLEAAWLGKGGAMVARLAGALELLAWSGLAAAGRPGHIGRDHVERAAALWTDYFRPQARAVFDIAAPSDFRRQVRRVARWLKGSRAAVVSREDVRCHALARTVNADEAQHVLQRLDYLGFVRPDLADDGGGRGRPTRRWQVNPALAGSKEDYRTTGK
jgi:hypothetical protein